MQQHGLPQILPAIMGALRQEEAEGELVLEQNDGCRRLYWQKGDLVHLSSNVAGEQFGNYLLRQGILDYATLSSLLASTDTGRLGDRMISLGLMSGKEKDLYLSSLQEQIMIHALEHALLHASWVQGSISEKLSSDLQFPLNHRLFVWNTFQEMRNLRDICDLLFAEEAWRWTGKPNLLDFVADLPLDPQTAFSLSFLGADPIGFQTFMSIARLDAEVAARLIMTLWALGELSHTQGELRHLRLFLAAPAPVEPPMLPSTPVEPPLPPSAPVRPPVPAPIPVIRPTRGDLPLILPPAVEGVTLGEYGQSSDMTIEILAVEEPHPVPGVKVDLPPSPRSMEIPKVTPASTVPDLDEAEVAESVSKARLLLVKAKSYLLQERAAEALRMLEQAVKLNPDTPPAFEAWMLLGKLRMSNPAWSTRTIEALQAASRLNPKAAEPWALMGELYHRKGFKANAMGCFRRALELDPSVPIAADVDPRLIEASPEPGPPPQGLLYKFRSILGKG